MENFTFMEQEIKQSLLIKRGEKIKIINKGKHELPFYKHTGDSGMDVKANLSEPVTLQPLERKLIHTGIYVCLPDGYEIQVRPRSGLALKHGITVLNTPGTVDSKYRDEIGVILVNLSNEPYTVEDGERIAQFVLSSVDKVLEWEEVTEFTEEDLKEDRGGGYGHSGRF